MNPFDRDPGLERRQIREISVNVARRLLHVLERRHEVPPTAADEIAAGARAIAEIQREIDGIMGALPPEEMLDIAVLTHVLTSHNRALGLIEDLELKLIEHHAERRPDPERTHAALIAAARQIEREAQSQEQGTHPAAPPPHSRPVRAASHALPNHSRPNATSSYSPPHIANHLPPAGHNVAPSRPGPRPGPASRPGPGPGPSPSPRASKAAQPGSRHAPPQPQSPRRLRIFHLVGIRTLFSSPISAVASVAGIAIVAASLAGAVSFALSRDDAEERPVAKRTPDGKFDGRLSAADSSPAGGSGILVVSPPTNTAPMTQPYLVVLATRRTTEELEQDFRYFQATHPKLLGDARGRVDSVQSQDGKTWHRLSLIPPRSQEDAAGLCAELKAAGLTECWIKPLPLGRDASR